MSAKFPENPPHPERLCWGCEQWCGTHALRCGNGSERTPHPVELFGDDWLNWGNEYLPHGDTILATPATEPGPQPCEK